MLMPFPVPASLILACAAIRFRRRALFLAFTLVLAVGALHAITDLDGDRAGVPFREGELTGRVLAMPERAAGGDCILRMVSGGRHFRLKVRMPPGAPEAAVLDLRRGDRIRLWARFGLPAPMANPGAFEPARALASTGIHRVGTVKNPRLIELDQPGSFSLLRVMDETRAGFRAGLDQVGAGDRAVRGLLGAMLLGDRAALPPELVDRLRSAGLVHLIAISGLHVGIILLLALGVLHRLPLPDWMRTLGMPLILTALVLLAGSSPSILRAAAMGLIAGWGRQVGRTGSGINTLAAVALALLILDPATFHHAGFRLSFAATAGILLGYRRVRWALPLPAFSGAPLAVSICAYLSTAPFTAALFGTVAPVSMISNLCSAPLCGLILVSGYPAMLLSSAGLPTLGAGWVARTGCRWLITMAESVPGSVLQVPEPSPWLAACLMAAIPLLAGAGGSRLRPFLVLVLSLALTCLHLGSFPGGAGSGVLEATVPDVGQGQAVLLRSGLAAVLADAGGSRSPTFDVGARVLAPRLAALGIHRLDVLAVSHEHLDHAGGAAAILKRFEVGRLWIVPGTLNRKAIRSLAELAWARQVPVVLAGRGVSVGGEGWLLSSLHPGEADRRLSVNDRSLVLRFRSSSGTVLLPGDLGRAGEEALLQVAGIGPLLDADLLVAGHHGAAGSSTKEFLAAVSPAAVLISAGRGNRYGHPDPATVQRFRDAGALVRSTHRWGELIWRREGSHRSVRGYTVPVPGGTPGGK